MRLLTQKSDKNKNFEKKRPQVLGQTKYYIELIVHATDS